MWDEHICANKITDINEIDEVKSSEKLFNKLSNVEKKLY